MTVLLAGSIAGCAGATKQSAGGFTGAKAAVAKVVDDLESAASKHDTGKICNRLLTSDAARRLGDCRQVIGKQLDTVDTFTATVEDVQIEGAKARVRVKSTSNGKDHRDALNLLKAADGGWRIASLG